MQTHEGLVDGASVSVSSQELLGLSFLLLEMIIKGTGASSKAPLRIGDKIKILKSKLTIGQMLYVTMTKFNSRHKIIFYIEIPGIMNRALSKTRHHSFYL